jgi:transcriptional regulator with XRE-family HTH domain
MTSRKRDPDGYALGPSASAVIAGRVRALLQKNKEARMSPRTQRQLSKLTGIPAPHVSDFLRGTQGNQIRNFQGWHIKEIARVFGISEEELLGDAAIVSQVANPPPGKSYLEPRSKPPTKAQLKFLAEQPSGSFIRGLLEELRERLQPGLADYFEKYGETINLLVARVMAEEYAWSEPDLAKDEEYWKRKQAYWENELRIRKEKKGQASQETQARPAEGTGVDQPEGERAGGPSGIRPVT